MNLDNIEQRQLTAGETFGYIILQLIIISMYSALIALLLPISIKFVENIIPVIIATGEFTFRRKFAGVALLVIYVTVFIKLSSGAINAALRTWQTITGSMSKFINTETGKYIIANPKLVNMSIIISYLS